MAKKETAAAAAPAPATEERKDVLVKGVVVTYIDSRSTIASVIAQRKLEGKSTLATNVFVHAKFSKDGNTIVIGKDEKGNLVEARFSQSLQYLPSADYQALLDSYQSGQPIDIRVRINGQSKQRNNYFFFVERNVDMKELYNSLERPQKPAAPAVALTEIVDIDE